MERLIDLDLLQVRSVLPILLQDKTTDQNIIWATDTYETCGDGYSAKEPIASALVTGENSSIIQPRIAKAVSDQADRTKKHAEVFTPAWICNMMVNHCDEVWFGRKDVFNTSEEKTWTPTEAPIAFPKRKRWQRYVDSRRLEITCGEAPYLVSRYDASTGELIPFNHRIGILDRKLRVVNENAADEEEWLKYAFHALESVYGFEYQGDNLLIARVNVLMTFMDAVQERWQREATAPELKRAAEIIAWNIWQMDGLKGTVPFGSLQEAHTQLSIWDLLGEMIPAPEENKRPECQIYDWRGQGKLKYNDRKTRKGSEMKFDFVIGNPPYQQETSAEVTTNGQKSRKNIFHHFQIAADQISKESTVLIYPGGRWIHQSGKGLKEFGYSQINDVRLSRIEFYPEAREIFGMAADLSDGITIVTKHQNKTTSGFEYVYRLGNKPEISVHVENPGDDLIPLNPVDISISNKIASFCEKYKLPYLHEAILPRTLFGIESDFVYKNPTKVRPLNAKIDFETEIKLFTNDKAGKAGRATWFIADKDVIKKNQHMIAEWQVVVSSANAGGQKRDNQLEIIDNHSAFGRARVALRSFKTESEAQNFFAYASTYFIRYAFLLTDEALTTLAKRVPDLENYTSNNGLIDFSKDLDAQLFKMCDFSTTEIESIKERVDMIRKKARA